MESRMREIRTSGLTRGMPAQAGISTLPAKNDGPNQFFRVSARRLTQKNTLGQQEKLLT
jgi:hypothetical protein